MGYFPFHDSYLERTNRLTDEQLGRLVRAASRYNQTGEECTDPDIGIAFDFFRADIDYAKDAYEKKCAINQINGSKGGRPKKTERINEKPKKANGFSETQKTQIKQNKEKQNKINTPLEDALEDFRKYRKSIRKPLNELSEKRILTELEKLSGGNESIKIQILDQSIRNGWTGVFGLKSTRDYAEHPAANLDHLLTSLDGDL